MQKQSPLVQPSLPTTSAWVANTQGAQQQTVQQVSHPSTQQSQMPELHCPGTPGWEAMTGFEAPGSDTTTPTAVASGAVGWALVAGGFLWGMGRTMAQIPFRPFPSPVCLTEGSEAMRLSAGRELGTRGSGVLCSF